MELRHSALDELDDRLVANGVNVDPLRVATAILGLARVNDWTEHPERMAEWIERLALEVVQLHPQH
jgi:hypothetical protein